MFHKVSGIGKIMDKREGGGKQYQDILLNVFQRRFPNILVEEPVCTVFYKISESEKVYGSEVGRDCVSRFAIVKFVFWCRENL